MKKKLVLEYLKEELRKLSFLSNKEYTVGGKKYTYKEPEPTIAYKYVYRLYTWYKQEQEVFASVTTIMDIFEYDYYLEYQYFITDYLKGLRVRLSSL